MLPRGALLSKALIVAGCVRPTPSYSGGCLLPLSPPPTSACSQDSEGLKLAVRSQRTALPNLIQLAEDSLLPWHGRTNGGWERRSQSLEAVVTPNSARQRGGY